MTVHAFVMPKAHNLLAWCLWFYTKQFICELKKSSMLMTTAMGPILHTFRNMQFLLLGITYDPMYIIK